MENHKRMFLTCVEEDRIKNLPEHLIGSILERLSVQEALKTSVLSKKWRYRWTTMTSLVLDKKFSEEIAKYGAIGGYKFIRIVNQLLILHPRPISKLYLYIPEIYLDSFQEVDQWMLFLSRNNVKELVLINTNWRYLLPSHVLSCSELRKLTLENCIFKSPLEFKVFRNLVDLSLRNIVFWPNFGTAAVNLPQLRNLNLHKCTHVFNFSIMAPKLRSLRIFTCPDAVLCQLMHSSCLTMVGILLWKPMEKILRREWLDLTTLLRIVPTVQQFCIDGHFIKCLSEPKLANWLPRADNRLKYLWFLNFQLGDLDHLQSALSLLQTSPNLLTLHIVNVPMEPRVLHYDVEPALNHLESPNCLGRMMNQLQVMVIKGLEGSRVELLFIKLLLAHTPSLNNMTIKPSGICDEYAMLNIAKDVMRFPRASAKAEIIYLDPRS